MTQIQIQNEIIARCERAKLDAHIQNARKWGRITLVKKGYTEPEARYIVEQAIDIFNLNSIAK